MSPGAGTGLLRLVALNLLRRPGRSFVAVLAVFLAAATTFAGGLISMGVNHAIEAGMGRLGADLMVVPAGAARANHTALVMGEPVAFYMDSALVQQVAAVPGVRAASPQTYVETLASSACCTGRLLLVGFDPASDFTVKPWLEQSLGRPLGPGEIIVGNHMLTGQGETMQFYGTEFTVAARLEPTGMGMDETVFLPREAVAAMAAASVTEAEQPLAIPPDSVSSVLIRLDDPDQAESVAAAISAAIPGAAVMTRGQIAGDVIRDLHSLMAWMLPIAAGVMLVSLLLFLILFAAITNERSREIGLLRAMGATARQAVASLIGEAVLLGAVGGAAGVFAGLTLYGLFKSAIVVRYVLPFLWPTVAEQALLAALVILAAGALGALAAAWPAYRIARLDPHYAIHRTN